jgi:hypothetical protein
LRLAHSMGFQIQSARMTAGKSAGGGQGFKIQDAGGAGIPHSRSSDLGDVYL